MENYIEKINKFTRREFTEEELYVFDLILCDNEIDRDCERFSDGALEKMSTLFIGKTGICDHNAAAANQNARIFDTELVTDTSRTTMNGEPYKYLKASAYMVRTGENKNLIAEIDGGIKKEVSISCSTAKRICSVCGCNKNKVSCSHVKGKNYNGKECFIILDEITDVYEWSFVAVPVPMQKTVKAIGKKIDNTIENYYNEADECYNSLRYDDDDNEFFMKDEVENLLKESEVDFRIETEIGFSNCGYDSEFLAAAWIEDGKLNMCTVLMEDY